MNMVEKGLSQGTIVFVLSEDGITQGKIVSESQKNEEAYNVAVRKYGSSLAAREDLFHTEEEAETEKENRVNKALEDYAKKYEDNKDGLIAFLLDCYTEAAYSREDITDAEAVFLDKMKDKHMKKE